MIVVTTPTGNIGHHTLQTLLGADEAVRVIVRDKAKLPQTIRDRFEVIQGSHGDQALVDRAFDGATAVLWVAPPNPSATLEDTYINFTRPAASAISRSSVVAMPG